MSIRSSRSVRKNLGQPSTPDSQLIQISHRRPIQITHRNATALESVTSREWHESPAPRTIRLALLLMAGPLLGLTPLLGNPSAHAIDVGGVKESAGAYVGVNPTSQARLQRKQDELIAACMKKQAFQTFPTAGDVPQDALDGGLTNRKSFVDKYGYGISTLTQPPKPGSKNKNVAYIEKLSPSDLRSYNLALYGVPTVPGNDVNLGTIKPTSCIAVAFTAVYGPLQSLQGAIDKLNDIPTRVNADTQVIKAMREWSSCMKKSGYSYTKDTEVEPGLNLRFQKLFAKQSIAGGPDLDSVDVAGLNKMKIDERAIAKADWDCSKKYLAIRDKTQATLEKKFIEENRPALDAIKKVFAAK
jgi:hypothetical protein